MPTSKRRPPQRRRPQQASRPGARPATTPPRSGQPGSGTTGPGKAGTAKGSSARTTPPNTSRRGRFEQRSVGPLTFLYTLPRWVLPMLTVSLLLLGLAVDGWVGALALLGVAGLLGWLLALAWPLIDTRKRVLRLSVVAVTVFAAVVQLTR